MTMGDYHGPHVKPPQVGCAAIDWSGLVGRGGRVRVQSYTCDCSPTMYELCAAAGLGHIRRTERMAAGDRVSESLWLRVTEVQRLWDSLLEGHAR
jgi:hypothetical protein